MGRSPKRRRKAGTSTQSRTRKRSASKGRNANDSAARESRIPRQRRRNRGAARKGRLKRLASRVRWGRAGYWTSVAAVWAGIALFGLIAYYAYDLPDPTRLDAGRTSWGVTFTSAKGEPLGTRGNYFGEMVTLRDLPPHLINAVLATEDRRFYDHFGLDVYGLSRAALANLRAGRVVQGGSTITQQLAKNLFLTPDRTLKRKIQEMLLALWLEQEYSKDAILTLYLNRVYLGAGAYGVDAAARTYFSKPATDLTLGEAAMIAGLLKAPSRYSPINNLDLAEARARQVLANMVDWGVLERTRAAAASEAPARIAGGDRSNEIHYFVDWLMEQLPDFVGQPRADLVVRTTLDPAMQRLAEKALRRALKQEGERYGVGQGAFIAMAPDGAVKAMVGGRSYAESQFNRATQARRQPGSAFKPFVYLTALERGYPRSMHMRDSPIIFGDWQPQNYSEEFRGEVSLEDALVHSINTVAVKVSEKSGRRRVIDTAHRLGIESPIAPHPSLALGTSEVTLLELTAAYAPFANGGTAVIPHGITEIRTRDGRSLYRRSGAGPGRVIGQWELGEMNAMLRDVLTIGTGKAANLPGRDAAGKTGTSSDFRDAWFIGYTPGLIAGVWMGNDDGSPTKGLTGGSLPARTWKVFMKEADDLVPEGRLPRGRDREAPVAVFDDLIARVRNVLDGLTGN